MVSERQLIANQQNALRSTGPQSDTGKAIVSRNAIKHGLFSKEIIVAENEREIFADFFEAVLNYFAPVNPLESALVERIIANLWRLRRVIEIETLIFNKESMEMVFQHSLMVQAQSNQNITTLSRYEQSLEKSLFRSLQAIEKLRGNKLGLFLQKGAEI